MAAKEVNESIESREFSLSAGSLHQYWLTQLCDTFIENSKFILTPDAPEAEQASAKQTLYTALEGGLLLLHPIMPFVTEHLWQKLPRRTGDTTPSIMVARYPQPNAASDKPKEAAEYEFIMALSSGIRSLLSQYNFKEPGEIFIQTYSDSAFETASAEQTSITSLGGKYVGDISILKPGTSNPPAGCAVYAVSAEAAVYLKIVGKVDLAQEQERAVASRVEAEAKVEKSRKIMGAKGWEKVKAETREKEERNLKDAESEVQRFVEVLRDLERLRMGE